MGFFTKITGTFRKFLYRLRNLSKKQKVALIVLILVLFAIAGLSPRGNVEEAPVNETRAVSLINVGEASTESTPLEVTGSVRSESEARLRTETQGEVVGVYRAVGQFVTAGTVIAELRNTSERAAVQQAEAALEAAEANLAKGTGGARAEELAVLEINVNNAQASFNSARTDAENTLLTAYSTIDGAVVGNTDDLFSNPESINPVLNLASSESETVSTLVQGRIVIQKILERQSDVSKDINNIEDLLSEIETTENETRIVRDFLDDLSLVVNNAIPTPSVTETAIAGYRTNVATAQTSVNGALTSLSAARNVLNNSSAALAIAEQNLEIGRTGAQSEDVTALEASVKQAEAGLSVARANLSRTLIITPISGTLNTLNLRQGDFASAFELAAIVANNNALEVETFVTEDDKDDIRVGSKATISGKYEGVVTSIATGLDPVTKKIEIRVGVVDESANLTNGSSVRLAIDRNGFEIDASEITEIIIPIAALKIETDRIIAFTVNNENALVPHEIATGLILGDSIVIEDGLNPEMNIVADARGLREGQIVEIANTN